MSAVLIVVVGVYDFAGDLCLGKLLSDLVGLVPYGKDVLLPLLNMS